MALTYYRPWISGLTIYVERLSKALAARGHQVTVLTSQYDRSLPRKETVQGVHVVRVPVAFRVSKGVVMPSIGFEATRQVLRNEVVSVHLPQLDAAGIALRGRLLHKPTVLTYHCDLKLPKGAINAMANQVVHVANRVAGKVVDCVVAYTRDYAVNSPFISRYLGKLHVIPPPVEINPVSDREVKSFIERYRQTRGPAIGIAVRLATEKGVEYLLGALPAILEKHPQAEVLYAGQHQKVLGEEEYARRLAPQFEEHRKHWTFLGILDPSQMSAFYRACDVTVLPSINSTESFGLVQIESMICGTPVVASNLPGVRQPVLTTGMGKIASVADSQSLAQAILETLETRPAFGKKPAEIAQQFSPSRCAQRYEALFEELLGRRETSRDQD